MNGTEPKFMENQVPAQSYFEQPNPYVNAPSCHVNLLELSRYAKRCGKKLVELTQEEVKKFSRPFASSRHPYDPSKSACSRLKYVQ